jgi:hypothetical protein
MPKLNLPATAPDPGALDVATLLALEIPNDCRAGLLANFALLRAHAAKLEAGLKIVRARKPRKSRGK